MWQLWKYWKVYPIHYFRYNFYKSNCSFGIEEMKKYIPDFFAYYLLFPKSYKDRGVLCEDKRLMYSIANGLDINQPNELFSIHNGFFFSPSLDILSQNDVLLTINESKSRKLFVKPTFGVGGKGIYIFCKEDGMYFCKEHNITLDSSFLNKIISHNYVVQEGVIQHSELNQIYPHSLNTFRIVTEVTNNMNVNILFSLLRMGLGGNQVDNASSGGIYVKIDKETGLFNLKAYSDLDNTFEEHPDTNFKFKDYSFPMWDEVISFAKKMAFNFCEIKYIGWDIAFSSSGPVLIEANHAPSIEIIQDVYGGCRNDFGINSSMKYWYSDNYHLNDS